MRRHCFPPDPVLCIGCAGSGAPLGRAVREANGKGGGRKRGLLQDRLLRGGCRDGRRAKEGPGLFPAGEGIAGKRRSGCCHSRLPETPDLKLQPSTLKESITVMPQGDKSAYTDKQKRQASHIAEGYEDRGVDP